MTETLIAMLTDPFRIVLLLGLVLTQRNTAAATGRVIPLAAGVVFVAALIPLTIGSGVAFWPAFGLGLVANLVWLAVILGGFALWDRRAR